MRILFVLEYYYPHTGGVEKLFRQLAEAMAKAGNKVMVITNRHEKGLPGKEIINGVEIKRLKLFNRFIFTFLSFPAIYKYARYFDIIHTTSYNAALPARLAAKLRKKKSVITFHEVWGELWFSLPFINMFQKISYYLFERCILKLGFDKFIAVSDATKNNLIEQGVDPAYIERIYNGILYPDPGKLNRGISKQFTFTYFGRLGISKGLEILIPAAGKFMDTHPDTIFKFISPTTPKNLYEKITRLIRKTKQDKRISLLHKLTEQEIQKELLSSDCIVIPSHSEGFCFVAAEVASLKTPVISSGKEALQEVVSGEHIVLEELTEGCIIEALVKAKNSNFDYIPLKKFPLNETINQYQKLYKSLTE